MSPRVLEPFCDPVWLHDLASRNAAFCEDSGATEEISKLLAQHPGSQVLSVQVQRDLSVHLNLFDSRTQQETAKILKCTDCADKDVLISRVQPEVVYQGLPPKTRNTLQALAWGGVAATTATGLILLGHSPTSAGEHRGPMGESIHYFLDGPGFTALGISGALLAVAVPTTILIRRNQPRAGGTAAATKTAPLTCPN